MGINEALEDLRRSGNELIETAIIAKLLLDCEDLINEVKDEG